MATGVPATIAANLIDKLNLIRIRPQTEWGNELEQVRFSVRALKSADAGAHLAVSSMIAALDGDHEELVSIASRLTPRLDLTDRFNVLLSLSVAGCTEKAWDLACELNQEAHDPVMVSAIADCMLTLGSLSRVLDLIHYRQEHFGLLAGAIEEERIATSLLEAGADDEMFSEFLRSVKVAIRDQGWVAPPILITECLSQDEGMSGVLARVMITTDPERALEVEDVFMDALIAAQEPMFINGMIACSVSLTEGPNG